MAEDFNIENAVAIEETPQGYQKPVSTDFNIENAIPVEATNDGISPYDAFRDTQTKEATKGGFMKENGKNVPLEPLKGPSKGLSAAGKPYTTVQAPSGEYPDEGFLNSIIHSVQGSAWRMVAKPIVGMKDPDMDRYLGDLEHQHPIGSTLGGTAPYIASSFLFPEALIPNVWGRTAVQFGAVSALGSIGHERVDETMKPLGQKALAVAGETAKGAAYSPIWAVSQKLNFIGRPFATTLAKAGIIGAGSTTLSTFFGDNITEAFKQGGILTALSLITEAPHLAKTVIGRGIVNHANSVYADLAVKTGLPDIKMEPEAPNLSEQVVKVTEALAGQIKGIEKPQIIAATVKLPDGSIAEGTSHKDIAEKIAGIKDNIQEGYTVRNADGTTRFITTEEAKKEFGIEKDSDVQGLNESKHLAPPEELKIVNPETLKKIEDNTKANEKIKESKAFARAREKYEEELADEPLALFNKIGIVDQTAKAFHLLENNPKEAREIVYGMREAPVEMRETAVSIAYTEKMLEEGNIKEFNNSWRSRSLRQTERGQEIVLERAASTNVNDPQNFMKEVLDARMQLLEEGKIDFSFKEKKVNKKEVMAKIKDEAKGAKKFLEKKKLDIGEAHKIIDALKC